MSEAVLRTSDLWPSCSTHAAGLMPIAITLASAVPKVVDQIVP
jgi:coenzyme F420-reducing hydrogenase alpha subunit